MDIGELIENYIRVRDKKKELDEEHKKRMEPYTELLEQMNGALLAALDAAGTDSISKTGVGTAYRTTKRSASLENPDEFQRHVIGAQDWDLLDWKANITAVMDFAEKNNALPPGVRVSQRVEVGVRRK